MPRVRIPRNSSIATGHIVRVSRARSRLSSRRWRRRGRRAQVAAVATILGLLLVVTFIANFLTTTLPNTMGQNDLKHEVLVQNQVAQLSALIQETAQSGAVSAQISQPISLGSAAAPPFAGQDGATVTALPNGTSISVTFTLVGPVHLPTGGTPNVGSSGGCNPNTSPPTSFDCTGSHTMNWNFSLGDGQNYSVNGNGGLHATVNFTTSNSTISVGQTGGAGNVVGVFGNGNTITVTGKGGASLVLLLVGNNNTVSMSSKGGATMTILVIGNYDSVSTDDKGGSTNVAAFYGSHDSYSDTLTSTVYFTGYNIESANSALCPYQNLANTDTVSGSGGTVYYNNTNSSGPGSHAPGWTYIGNNPAPFACPYVVSSAISQTPAGTGFVVGLRNTYAPSAEVAYDEGAEVYAQPGGLPVFIVPPRISYGHGQLQVFVPQFANRVNGEAGVGTADASLRLIAANQFIFPGSGFNVGNNTPVTIKVVTPYAAAWYAYFLSNPSTNPFVTCSGARNVCTAVYAPGGPLGTVTLVLPMTGVQLELLVGLYSFALA